MDTLTAPVSRRLTAWVGRVGLLALVWVLAGCSAVPQGAAPAQTQAQAGEQESLLATAKAGFVEPQLDPQLPAEVAARQAENGQLQGLLNYLRVLAEQQNAGFVAPLQALAEHHPQGRLWLTGIHLDQGGTQLRLQGRAQSQQLLPGYLDALGRSPVFSGREFARLDVERGEDGLLDFDLSSRPADQEKADE